MYICTLNFLQKLTSLQFRSSKSDDEVVELVGLLQITAVADEVKTTLSIVSVWAHASNTLCAALTSISAIFSCSHFECMIHDHVVKNLILGS